MTAARRGYKDRTRRIVGFGSLNRPPPRYFPTIDPYAMVELHYLLRALILTCL